MRTDLLALLAIVGFAVLTMPVYAARRSDREDPLESSARGTFVLGSFVREWFYWFVGPLERGALSVGVSPLFLNLTGVVFGILAGACFATGQMVLGGWAVLAGGAADVLDGRVARALGVAGPKGAFLDSTLDRFAEFAAFAGLAVWFRDSSLTAALVVLALGGSLLVSYTRARGESLGVVCKVGVMQRAERLLLLGFGGLLDPMASVWMGHDGPGGLLVPVLGIVAFGTVATAIYRTVWITRRLPGPDG